MAQSKVNPVRGNYLLIGTDLVRCGIKDGVVIREDNATAVYLVDPATERWMTSRAVAAACAQAGIPLTMSSIAVADIKAFLAKDRKAIVRTTEEHILHMLGGDTPDNRAFAKAEIERLQQTYGAVKAA